MNTVIITSGLGAGDPTIARGTVALWYRRAVLQLYFVTRSSILTVQVLALMTAVTCYCNKDERSGSLVRVANIQQYLNFQTVRGEIMSKITGDPIFPWTTQVGWFEDKMGKSRLMAYGHVQRRDAEYIRNILLRMELPGRRSIGRPKRRFMSMVKVNM